ncbi:glycosyltransferase family 4 protein [Nesterenkonia sp. K-15-9-6]|uniref:glycosyltransferase family 4 protein n=1 Tax=Nesterenkonia sp. K-15-9-6 TaxID=3093918 RepID=UPI0040449A17
MTPPDRLIWVEPDLPGPSGGSLYNARVIAGLDRLGLPTEVLRIPGAWPSPDEDSRAALRTTLTARRTQHPAAAVVVDGLIGSAAPELFSPDPDGQARPVADILLIHLPLEAEHERPGTEPAQVPGPAPSDQSAAEQRAVTSADRVVTTSQWAAEDLHRRHGRDDVDVVVPGADPADAPPGRTTRASGDDGPWRLTVAASLTPRKNHLLLAEALGSLLDQPWVLQVAGPGGETDHGSHVLTVLRRRLPGRVIHHGALTPGQMKALWEDTDLVLLPSWAETYGMVVVEACAHGVPGIVSAGTGAVEALGAAGDVADPARPEQWALRLRRWMEDPSLRGRWAEAARTRADSLPTWEKTANHWHRLIGSLPNG